MSLPEWVHQRLHIPYMLATTRAGKGGHTVVFLHGIAGHKESWDAALHDLSTTCRCVSIDLLGHGQSPKPTYVQYDASTHVRSIRWTLFWHGIYGHKIVVGHSMGSLLAIDWAARCPREITRLILVAIPIYRAGIGEKRWRLEAMIDTAYLRFYRTLRAMPRSLAIRSARALIKHSPSLDGQVVLDKHTWYPIASSLKMTVEEQNTTAQIAGLPAVLPITVIYGSADRLVVMANIRRAFAAQPHTRFVPVACGHELRPEFIRAARYAIDEALATGQR